MKNPLTSETLHTADASQWIAERPPLIEICPTSNSFTLNLTDLKDHPTLGIWIKTGYPIAISTGNSSFTFVLFHAILLYRWDSMIWYGVTQCYATPYYAMLCYIMLYYVTHSLLGVVRTADVCFLLSLIAFRYASSCSFPLCGLLSCISYCLSALLQPSNFFFTFIPF